MIESSLDDLRKQIEQAPGTVYAILDACDEPRVPETVRELGPERAVCLYRGSAEQEYWAIAPYLVVVDNDLLDWIVENLWNDPWGIFVGAPMDLATLRKHFRRFLIVADPDGKQMFFRFYDPSVLPTFLMTCTQTESNQFFSMITSFWTKRDEGVVSIVLQSQE